MNVAHQLGRLKNRFKRLKKQVDAGDLGADRKGPKEARMKEIAEELRRNKVEI